MFRSIDTGVDWLSGVGWNLSVQLSSHPYAVAATASVALVAISGASRWTSRHGVGAILLATWAQAFVLADRVSVAIALFVASFAVAVFSGRQGQTDGSAIHSPLAIGWDSAAVATLAILSAVLRLYAIEAMPWFVDVEPGGAFLESLTPYGLGRYITHNRVLDDGFVHMLGRWLSVHTLGPGIVALRAVSVAFGTISVLLCYGLARHFASPLFAFLAAFLLATDPAHLFWSRIEASQIIASTVSAFLGAYIAIWLARTWSISAGLATMMWMPITRYFYAATIGLAGLPAILVAWGLTQPRRRRAVLRTTPLILIGGLLWFQSSSLLHFAATGHWQDVSPLLVYGSPLFEPHDPENAFEGLSGIERARVQTSRLGANTTALLRHMAHHRPTFSNWLMMAQSDEDHRRSLNAAVFAVVIPAIGYLFGTIAEPRQASLLLWLLVLALPGLFSEDPVPRRVAGLMAGSYVAVFAFIATLDTNRRTTGLIRRHALRAGVVLAVAVIALVNLSSHIRTGRQETGIGKYIEFAAPVFSENDVIHHNIEDGAAAAVLIFGNAGTFIEKFPCFHYVEDMATQRATVSADAKCSFDREIYEHLYPKPVVEARSRALIADRVAYWLELASPADVERYYDLRERFPDAKVQVGRFFLPPRGPVDVVVLSTWGRSRSQRGEAPG